MASIFERLGGFRVEEASGLKVEEVPINLELGRASGAVTNCTMNIRSEAHNPHAVCLTINGLYGALGYSSDQLPEVAIRSIEDYHPGEESHPRLRYTPLDRGYPIPVHIAGITGFIADAPTEGLDVQDRAVLIATLVSGYGESMYDGWDVRMGSPAIRKGLAIRAARYELIARSNEAIASHDHKMVFYYEDLLRAVNKETMYPLRVAVKSAGVILTAMLAKRLRDKIRS